MLTKRTVSYLYPCFLIGHFLAAVPPVLFVRLLVDSRTYSANPPLTRIDTMHMHMLRTNHTQC